MKILIANQHVNDVIGKTEAQCGLIAIGLTKLCHSVIYGLSIKITMYRIALLNYTFRLFYRS